MEGTTRDTTRAAVNLVTLGGYSGYKRAEARGELAAGGLAGGRAYLHGVANFATFGWLDTAEDAAEQGGTLGEGTKAWLGEASGYTDVAEGGSKLGEGEYLEGGGRILTGAGKGAGWIVGARVAYARATQQPLVAFGRNIGGAPRIRQGGAYRDVAGGGTHGHHMPAKSASPLSKGEGPAIRMEPCDHCETASFGSSRDAQAYRARQRELIEQGRFDEAQQMDINDVREKFGRKYDRGIREMQDYTRTIGPEKLRPPPQPPGEE